MYFPDDMTFQYFFLDTYIGYFLQALPIALIVSAIYGIIRYRTDNTTPIYRKIFSCVFVCYMTGLVCLVVGLDITGIAWYKLLYQMDPGRTVGWFSGEFDFGLDFFNHISGEVVGNFLMFLPFGILHPLSKATPSWKNTALAGVIVVLAIEILQPIFGRAFDLNDIVLNTFGILLSTSVFFGIKYLWSKKSIKF